MKDNFFQPAAAYLYIFTTNKYKVKDRRVADEKFFNFAPYFFFFHIFPLCYYFCYLIFFFQLAIAD